MGLGWNRDDFRFAVDPVFWFNIVALGDLGSWDLAGAVKGRQEDVGFHCPCVLIPRLGAATCTCVNLTYTLGVETKTERWTLRVTPAQDAVVRQVLNATGMSLNEYVVGCAVDAATNDLADRQVFVLDSESWDELQDLLDQPPDPNPRIATLLAQPSILERE